MSDDLIKIAGDLAAKIADYREGELEPPTPTHVLRWIEQFDPDDRLIVLSETDHVLGQYYIPKKRVENFIGGLLVNAGLAGTDPKEFWKGVGFLKLQTRSQSQNDLLSLMGKKLQEQFDLSVSRDHSTNKTYVYIDDAMFSGTQVRLELCKWINETAEADATINVIVFAYHGRGQWYAKKKILEAAKKKNIKLNWWRVFPIDDWRKIGDEAKSQVLWPREMPDDPFVKAWFAAHPDELKFCELRKAPGSTAPFSSDDARNRLEQAFLRKGAYICSLSRGGNSNMRPLGFHSLKGFGFGTMLATYRNCPNNCPLVLWWGDPTAGRPLNQWYPLLQRRVRTSAFDTSDF